MAFNTDMADSEDDEVLIVDPDLCKCGKKHGTQASPNPRGTKDELMRLGMVLLTPCELTSKGYSRDNATSSIVASVGG